LVFGLVSIDAATVLKIPATDITVGNGGTSYLNVEFYIKPSKGLKKTNEADLRLTTDAELALLRVFGHQVPARAGKAAYYFLDSDVETIESNEAGTMLAHWDFETAQKLWKFQDWQAKKGKNRLVTV
jgi:hypothetical protein